MAARVVLHVRNGDIEEVLADGDLEVLILDYPDDGDESIGQLRRPAQVEPEFVDDAFGLLDEND